MRAIKIGDVDALQRVVAVHAEVLGAAAEQEREEEFVAGRVAAGEQMDGLYYPLGERWRPAYEVWLAERKP
jgi:5-oxopent-3-ene-1,2,5-tricarboxylate decarboxylase / 2-hydroxyhepta-2,4-diene-1,7-dioate isomerase